MAISFDRPMYQSLNTWQRVMQNPIFHFNQAAGSGLAAPLSEAGQRVYVQEDREHLAIGLWNAIDAIAEEVKFYPFPVWIDNELHPVDAGLYLETQTFSLQRKHVQTIGRRAVTVLQDDAAVVYTDTNGDGIHDRATITATVPAGTDPREIKVFFRFLDGADATADPRFEIDTLYVTVSGTTATITGHRALFVLPEIWRSPYENPNQNRKAIHSADTTNGSPDFVGFVDVVRVYASTTGAVTLLCDPFETAGDSTSTTYTEFSAGALLTDPKRGEFSVRNAGGAPAPARVVRVSYLAGYPLDSWGQIDVNMANAVVRLGNCRVPVPPTDRSDMRLSVFINDNGVDVAQGATNAPRFVEENTVFGLKRGEVAAFKIINTKRIPARIRGVRSGFAGIR